MAVQKPIRSFSEEDLRIIQRMIERDFRSRLVDPFQKWTD